MPVKATKKPFSHRSCVLSASAASQLKDLFIFSIDSKR